MPRRPLSVLTAVALMFVAAASLAAWLPAVSPPDGARLISRPMPPIVLPDASIRQAPASPVPSLETAAPIVSVASPSASPTPANPGTSVPADSPTASPAAATATPPPAAVERLRIPAIGIDSAVAVGHLDANSVMESPPGPTDVLWYEFTAHPGTGSNAVFAGHVDYHDYGPAVFWDLGKLRPGDLVEVTLADGQVLRYAVTASNIYAAAEAPVADIVGPTPQESVTLITCAGNFIREAHTYDARLVVRALRLS